MAHELEEAADEELDELELESEPGMIETRTGMLLGQACRNCRLGAQNSLVVSVRGVKNRI